MTALDQLRTTHRRAETAGILEQALRNLCDVLLGDDLDGEALYDAIEQQVTAACDALDTFEHPPGVRLEPPETPTEDNTRLCAFTGEAISSCTCRTCTARRAPGIPVEAMPTDEDLAGALDPAPPVEVHNLSAGHCADTCRPALSCICPAHTAWRASGAAGTQTCRTCDQDIPIADFPRSGGGWSKACRPCVAERNARNKRGRGKHQRERADDKESA